MFFGAEHQTCLRQLLSPPSSIGFLQVVKRQVGVGRLSAIVIRGTRSGGAGKNIALPSTAIHTLQVSVSAHEVTRSKLAKHHSISCRSQILRAMTTDTSNIIQEPSLLSDLSTILQGRRERGQLRSLSNARGLVDFCSNDYLGFAKSEAIRNLIHKEEQSQQRSEVLLGSTGSRLLSGNSTYAEHVEEYLSTFYKQEAALIFSSGYMLNFSVVAYLPQPGDVVFYDSLDHNSIREGMKLTRAKACIEFNHNDVCHLRKLMEHYRQADSTSEGSKNNERKRPSNFIVIVESVYSMDGDVAPIKELANLCREFKASLIIDEAHSAAVFGRGKGLVVELGLQNQVFGTVYTFGKGMGCHGAAILGSSLLKEYLLNYARPLIYSTSLPFHSLATIKAAHLYCESQEAEELRAKLQANIERFRSKLVENECDPRALMESDTAIQGIIIPGNPQVIAVASRLRAQGFDVRPIRSPTVPKGLERLRIIIHASNTEGEIDQFAATIGRILRDTSNESDRQQAAIM